MLGIRNSMIPESCSECQFYVGEVGHVYCKLTKSKVGVTVACYERMKDCPLVEIKEEEK